MPSPSIKSEMNWSFAASCNRSIIIYILTGAFINYIAAFAVGNNPIALIITSFVVGLFVIIKSVNKIFENVDKLINERITQLEEQRQHD